MNSKTQPIKTVKLLFICLTALSILSSCASYDKIPYFQDLSRTRITSEALNNYTPLTIQPLDQLSINVGSLNPEASAVFNNNMQNAGANPNNPTYGYLVSETGEVKLPLVGTMKVSGLTAEQMATQLQQRLLTY